MSLAHYMCVIGTGKACFYAGFLFSSFHFIFYQFLTYIQVFLISFCAKLQEIFFNPSHKNKKRNGHHTFKFKNTVTVLFGFVIQFLIPFFCYFMFSACKHSRLLRKLMICISMVNNNLKSALSLSIICTSLAHITFKLPSVILSAASSI